VNIRSVSLYKFRMSKNWSCEFDGCYTLYFPNVGLLVRAINFSGNDRDYTILILKTVIFFQFQVFPNVNTNRAKSVENALIGAKWCIHLDRVVFFPRGS